jgi:hypothetical protein
MEPRCNHWYVTGARSGAGGPAAAAAGAPVDIDIACLFVSRRCCQRLACCLLLSALHSFASLEKSLSLFLLIKPYLCVCICVCAFVWLWFLCVCVWLFGCSCSCSLLYFLPVPVLCVCVFAWMCTLCAPRASAEGREAAKQAGETEPPIMRGVLRRASQTREGTGTSERERVSERGRRGGATGAAFT